MTTLFSSSLTSSAYTGMILNTCVWPSHAYVCIDGLAKTLCMWLRWEPFYSSCQMWHRAPTHRNSRPGAAPADSVSTFLTDEPLTA